MDLCFWGMISVTQRTTPLWCSWHFLLHRSVNSGGVFNSAELLNQFCDTFYHILWKQINSNGETDAMISDQLMRLGLLLVGEKKRKDPDRGFEWKWATGVIQGQGRASPWNPQLKTTTLTNDCEVLWGIAHMIVDGFVIPITDSYWDVRMISFQSLQSLGTNTEPISLCQPTLIFLSLSNSSKVKPLLTLHVSEITTSIVFCFFVFHIFCTQHNGCL